ncbi:uncharacterized protein LOC133174889 [Saccostrea echinata]|uniref:uncharacterized protein LOC133174889 n=1 Tax=Saccostrea echinata TaxID=191078 RepID=UPI002A81E48D|nr:uncharacterized protein LOC133174889 [Saccostrea echinata]
MAMTRWCEDDEDMFTIAPSCYRTIVIAFLYIILFLGLVIAATGLLGCLGGISRSICLLKCYTGFMVAFIFIEVAIAIGAYTQQDQIPSLITSTWPKLNNDTKFTLQAGLECCGVNNYTEYGFELADIPQSCFKVYDTLTVHTKSWTLLFQTPCLQQIENWFSANLPIWVTILILICIVQFVSMGLGITVIVKIEEQTKVHPAPDPPDEEQPPDGATIVCSESLHPESSHISEFSDQLSLSSASGDTTARKLSEVPEEEEDRLSSGVVCCNSKDDLDASTTGDHVEIEDHMGTGDHVATSEDHVEADKVDAASEGAGALNEEVITVGENENGNVDNDPKEAALLVFYDENTKQYENQKSPTFNESRNEVDPEPGLVATQGNTEGATNQQEDSIHGNQETGPEKLNESTHLQSTDSKADRQSLLEEYQHNLEDIDKSNLQKDASVNEMVSSKDG